jgi:predicted aminopeptidase
MALACALLLGLGGCANLAYYAQAVGGHMQVMHSARPIPRLIESPDTAPALREKLVTVADIRDFASRELALPDNGSYRSYGDLGRPYVVWNVFAAEEFSVEPEKWCMLVVGCVNYRGYYSRQAAERFAETLREKGLETYVAGIPAYSTLGFFDDPVLNTFLRFGEQEVARTIFHELAHQVAFVRGDTTFNESFATTVENEGMRRWLARHGNAEERRAFLNRKERKANFLALLRDYRERLREIYARPWPSPEKRQAKERTLAELQRGYADLRARWGGQGSYDLFFDGGVNNAKLGSVSLYTSRVPAFEALLEQENHNLPRFYDRVKKMARMDKDERRAVLDSLTDFPAGEDRGARTTVEAGDS